LGSCTDKRAIDYAEVVVLAAEWLYIAVRMRQTKGKTPSLCIGYFIRDVELKYEIL